MAESTEVLLARIDERTKATHEKLTKMEEHNSKQDERLGALERWRTGIVGGVTALIILIPVLLKLFSHHLIGS